MSMRSTVRWGTGIALCAVLAGPAAAQVAPTREEVQRAAPPPAAPEALQVDTEDGIERAPCPLANPEFAAIRFTLSSVEFANGEAIDPALLSSSWAAFAGTEVPVAAICDIRDRAATALRRAGYLAAVQVPEQRIEQGVVRLNILAARLAGLQVRGDAGPNEGQLARHLANLEGQPLFNTRQAERYLLLANTIPGLSARLTLRPTGTPGDVVGEVIVNSERMAIDFAAQNYGSTSVGRIGGIARARLFGLTGMADETSFGVYSTFDTDEQQVVQAGHNFRIGGDGLTVGGDFTYAWTRPTLPGNIPIRSETLVGTLYARYPLTLTQTSVTTIGAGLDWIDQDVRLATAPVTTDKIRVLWARLDASWVDPSALTGRGGFTLAEPRWQAQAMIEGRQGIGIFGASNGCRSNLLACFAPGVVPVSRVEADTTATVIRASADIVWRPAPTIAFATALRGQYAARPLLSYEEFAGGNFTVGRGYDPGTVIGDSGVGVSVEMRVGSAVPVSRESFAIQPFGFVDNVWVWNEDSSLVGFNPQRLVSAGGGVRATWGDRARLDIAIAEPLRRAGLVPIRPDTRLLISLTTSFGVRR